MIAGTFFKELAEKQNTPVESEEKKQVGIPKEADPFVKVKFGRCCVTVEVSLEKDAAAKAMSKAVKPLRKIAQSALPGIKI